MPKNWEYAAGVLWPHLIAAAAEKRTLLYSELAPYIATNPRNVDKALGPIFYYCKGNNLPSLTSIVINKKTRKPGSGFTNSATMTIAKAQGGVYRYNWSEIVNPFGGFGENDTRESFSLAILNDPTQAQAIYSRVKARGSIQAIFRATLLKAYEGQCSICGLSFEEALEAAHIVPWSNASPADRISPRNGILLCANHHRLFDGGWIRITETRKIQHVTESVDDYSEFDLASTVKFHKRKLHLPKNRKVWPAKRCLRRRLQLCADV